MSAVIITIISVGCLLAGLILYGQIVNKGKIREEIKAMREEMREQLSKLRQKIDANNEI